nr:MAG TPA: Sporulation protein YhaL [Caudoviricetes sp.]
MVHCLMCIKELILFIVVIMLSAYMLIESCRK